MLTIVTDTGSGGYTHRYFRAPMTWEEQLAGRDAIAAWARLTYGWLGRAPDYKGAFLGTLGANAAFYAPYEDNARAWYKKAQEQVLFLNHAIIHPPVDRDRAIHERADVCVHVVQETDRGIYVSGAKIVATGSALTHATFVAHNGLLPVQDKRYACVFMVPMHASGVKLINPALCPYLDKYLRGSGGHDAEHRVKLMKLLWDAIGTEFGARHELYEINYSGSTEENRLTALNIARATGLTERMQDLVHTCMAEYDLNGWRVPDLLNPDDVSRLSKP